MDTNQMSFNRWLDKQIEVHTHIYSGMKCWYVLQGGEPPKRYAKERSQTETMRYLCCHLYEISRIGEYLETESRLCFPWCFLKGWSQFSLVPARYKSSSFTIYTCLYACKWHFGYKFSFLWLFVSQSLFLS